MRALNRREFLGGAATLPLIGVSTANAAGDGEIHCFVEESGVAGESPFVLAALTCREPARHRAELARLRQSCRWHHALFYWSTSLYKEQYAFEGMRYLLSDPDVSFSAQVHTNLTGDASQLDVRYFEAVGTVVRDNPAVHGNSQLRFRLENRSQSGRDELLAAFLREKFDGTTDVEIGSQYEDDLQQFCGFLAGTISSELRQPTSEVKTSLLSSARELLGVNSLTRVRTRRISVK